MERLLNQLIDLVNEEIDSLYLGHPFNEDRLASIRSLLSAYLYLKYAVLSNTEIIKLLEIYS